MARARGILWPGPGLGVFYGQRYSMARSILWPGVFYARSILWPGLGVFYGHRLGVFYGQGSRGIILWVYLWQG